MAASRADAENPAGGGLGTVLLGGNPGGAVSARLRLSTRAAYHPRMPTLTQALARLRVAGRPGILVLPLGALIVALHVWLARSVLVPIEREGHLETVFVSATIGTFASLALWTLGLLIAGHVATRRLAARRTLQPPLLSREDVAYLLPLFCFAASALPLCTLSTGSGGPLSVWLYLVVDLRWWWTALVLLWVLAGFQRRVHLPLRAWIERLPSIRGAGRWAPEVALVAIAVTWVVAGTPHLRFDATTHGDEPKYVRYCELFYQGLGFEISQLRPIAELPADFKPRVWQNFVLLAETLPGELRSLAADAIAFFAEPSRRFNRARRIGGFLEGKDGGVYQIYNPGISMLMFPAYYLDRRLGGVEPGSPAQWPAELNALNGFFLGLYALWSLVIFRFLRRCVGANMPAWIVTLALTLTLPVAAFPFQFYPETAAGVLLSAVAAYLLFPEQRTSGAPYFYGLLAGYLPWLHVRFSVLSGVLALSAIVTLRRSPRAVLGFLGGFALTLGSSLLYSYHLTGSILPTAMWLADGSGPAFSWQAVLQASAAYLVDREWGLFANSPVYLAALPGYWWVARRRPDVAWLSAVAFAALLTPAAGHTLHAAGGTPMRLIVAALPLAATPLVEVIARHGRLRLFQVVFGLLLLVSLQNALAYNLHHFKEVGGMVDWSFSGWKVNLLFPFESREAWRVSAANGGLLVAWLVAALALLLTPLALARAGARGRPRRLMARKGASVASLVIVMTLAFGLLGTGVSAVTGVSSTAKYRIPSEEAALRAAALLENLGRCDICAISPRGRINTRTMRAQLDAVTPLVARRPQGSEDVSAYRDWLQMPGRIRGWYKEAHGREPTDADLGHYLYLWREKHATPDEVRQHILRAATASAASRDR